MSNAPREDILIAGGSDSEFIASCEISYEWEDNVELNCDSEVSYLALQRLLHIYFIAVTISQFSMPFSHSLF